MFDLQQEKKHKQILQVSDPNDHQSLFYLNIFQADHETNFKSRKEGERKKIRHLPELRPIISTSKKHSLQTQNHKDNVTKEEKSVRKKTYKAEKNLLNQKGHNEKVKRIGKLSPIKAIKLEIRPECFQNGFQKQDRLIEFKNYSSKSEAIQKNCLKKSQNEVIDLGQGGQIVCNKQNTVIETIFVGVKNTNLKQAQSQKQIDMRTLSLLLDNKIKLNAEIKSKEVHDYPHIKKNQTVQNSSKKMLTSKKVIVNLEKSCYNEYQTYQNQITTSKKYQKKIQFSQSSKSFFVSSRKQQMLKENEIEIQSSLQKQQHLKQMRKYSRQLRNFSKRSDSSRQEINSNKSINPPCLQKIIKSQKENGIGEGILKKNTGKISFKGKQIQKQRSKTIIKEMGTTLKLHQLLANAKDQVKNIS